MGDRSGSKHNHGNERNGLLLDQCSSNECNAKHFTRKRNLLENSEISQKQLRKQSTSEEEDDELDLTSNFFDDDDDDDDNSSTIEEPDDDTSFSNANSNQTFSGSHAAQAISSLFRNSNSDNQKADIGISYQFHGHSAVNSNGTTRSFANTSDSTCHHHAQQFVYTGYMPTSSHYVVSCGTVPGNNNNSICDSSYGRVNSIPANTIISNGTMSRSMNQQEPNAVESFVRHPFNGSRSTICNFGLNRTMYNNFGNSFPTLHSMPMLASEIFCAVPGRTSLLSSTTKYHVTIGEIYRRISPPECLNASLLGGILRKAKSKDGGKTLRDSLKRVGLTLPAGRRKAATVTAWTALVEEEALQMAKDFGALSEKAFPVRQIAEFICSRMVWPNDPREHRTFIEHTRILIKELSDIVNGERTRTVTINQPNTLAGPAMQHSLAHFSLLTHGFGPLAFVAVFDTLVALLDEMIKYCDRDEQHLNVPLSVISVTHIPSNRFSYNSNM